MEKLDKYFSTEEWDELCDLVYTEPVSDTEKKCYLSLG